MDVLEAIERRRSIGRLVEPAPSDDDLKTMLRAAVLAPDHKNLQPWRFIILRGFAKDEFGTTLANTLLKREPDATQGQLEKARTKLSRAPVVIAVATERVETSLPFVELISATAAATQNLLLAATALGYGSMWRTGDISYDTDVKHALNLDANDEIVGFIYLGSIVSDTSVKPRDVSIDAVTRYLE